MVKVVEIVVKLVSDSAGVSVSVSGGGEVCQC